MQRADVLMDRHDRVHQRAEHVEVELLLRVGEGRVRVAKYDELLQVVLDAQLSLETMARNLRVEGGLFAAETGVVSSVTAAEVYLRELVGEYEAAMPAAAAQGSGDMPTPPRLADFIGPYLETSPFRNQFIHPIQASMAAIERLIAQAAPPP